MNLFKVVQLVLILLGTHGFILAQESDSSLLSLERIYTLREFSTKGIGRTQWLDDGNSYTKLERSESISGSRDIVSYDVITAKREILVPANLLIPPGKNKPLLIESYEISLKSNLLMIYTNSKKVWRANTRGDYWVLDLNNLEIHQLGGNAKPSSLMFATFSPDGQKVAYVSENNLYIEDLKSYEITPITTDGSSTIINGTFDWVYEEEFSLRNGFRWSRDSKRIAYWQLDSEGVGVFHMINNTDSIYSYTIPVQYPKVGTTNSACRVGVVSVDGGETKWFKVPGDPRNHYIARMDWAASSDEIILQQLNRLQNTNKIMLGDANSGDTKTIFTDRDSAWVEVINDLKWLNGGKEFTWISEMDGWRHIYRISRTGKNIQLITKGNYDVISILGIDDKDGWIYFIASLENPTQRYLYRIRLDGSGDPEKLTLPEFSGSNRYNITPNYKYAFHTHSSMDNPPITNLISLPKHESIRILEDNSQLRKKLSLLKKKPTNFFRVEIENGFLLDGYIIKPYNFNPNKKYPVLFYVYGEPAGQTARDAWGGTTYLWHLMLAQQGYIIINIDNRGTPAPRGRDWRKIIYGQIGILASADQAAVTRIIRNWNYIDSTRIGIWGWSGGGSMSLNAIFRYPDLYQLAMAIAFISDQRVYDTIYQERYMGLPSENEYGYKYGSPITYANQLKGDLLLIHGTGDDNCHYQSAEMLINELIKHNKMFTVMPYPNRSHSIDEGENTQRHLFETLTWYLNNHISPGPSDN